MKKIKILSLLQSVTRRIRRTKTIEPVEEVREIEITIDYDRLEKAIYAAVYQAIKSVEGDHLREG